ncbi:MAG: alpha-2-macroglobulin family protein [Bacteroidales bacterium]|nr:alpha-2-macroglobulin family protein [Bacteroidales bacterium]
MKKVLTTFLFTISAMSISIAQPAHNEAAYNKQWDALDKLIEKAAYNSAYDQASTLFAQALQESDSRQTLTGAFYLARIENAYRENAADSTLQRYLSIRAALQPADQAICNALLAQFYFNYKENNRWTIADNKPTNEADLDYKLWPLSRFDDTVNALLDAALSNEQLLTTIPVDAVKRFATSNGAIAGAYNLTPTLFDVLAQYGYEAYSADKKETLLKRLIDFHASDDDCIRLHLDIQMRDLLNGKDVAYETISLINKYRGSACPILADLYYDKATMLDSKGDYVSAVAYCDTAATLFPKSAGAANCLNLKNTIAATNINVSIQEYQMESRHMLAKVTARNASTLHFRIVRRADMTHISGEQARAFLSNLPVIKSWQQDLETREDYSYQRVYSYLPPLPAGEYFLLVSPGTDFAQSGMAYTLLNISDACLIPVGNSSLESSFCLLSRSTGKPLAGKKVRLIHKTWNDRDKVIATKTTDNEGYVSFAMPDKEERRYYYYYACYDDNAIRTQARCLFANKANDTSVRWNIFLDRPVYKPGESVSFMALCYVSDGHTYARAEEGRKNILQLRDVNGKVCASQKIATDAYGQAHGSFVLPADAMPGVWKIQGDGIFRAINVQYYKQPKFSVQLPADSAEHRFGQPVEVTGRAISYTQMPVSAAQVEWSVERSQIRPYWRWWWHDDIDSEARTVASGSAATQSDGTFRFSFVPQPDSEANLNNKPCFEYTINVKVTDLNGENHEQTRRLRIGYENSGITMPGGEVSSLETLSYQYVNLDGQPLEGDMLVTVEELQQPRIAQLDPGLDSQYTQSLGQEEFRRRFPLYLYSAGGNDPSQWPTKRTVLKQAHHASRTAPNKVPLPSLGSGVYRVTVGTVNAFGDTVSATTNFTLTLPNEHKAQSTQLIWHDVSAHTLEVGDTLTLRVGTRFKDVIAYYGLEIDGLLQERRQFMLSNEIKTIKIPIVEKMRGGFVLYLFAAKENMTACANVNITVPYSNKRLNVRFITFRDKLEPGQQEIWTLEATETLPPSLAHEGKRKQDKADATLMATMYDAALNTYGLLEWNLWPWQTNQGLAHHLFRANNGSVGSFSLFPQAAWQRGNTTHFLIWTLRGYDLWDYGNPPGAAKLLAVGNARYESTNLSLNEEVVLFKDDSDASAATVRVADAATPAQNENKGQADEPAPLRTNLNTLAFFEPQLRTDVNGRASITFTVPELLTEWHIQGLAYNKELQVGNLLATAVTSKEIMVVPNAPRFFRQGDKTDFLIKVSNASGETQDVEVSLEMTDAATGKAFFFQSQSLLIDAGASCPATFSFDVPHDIFAATYRVIAKGKKHSDGEQDVIPVLTNHTLVTESMSMYINGKGEKRYVMNSLKNHTSATLKNKSLTVEFSANPIWYAIQALPYVEEHENPSNIYLANSIYANALGSRIVNENPNIKKVFENWMRNEPDALTSKLEQNEDIKQTLLRETPWLRDGQDETARMRRVATFFDEKKIEKTLDKAIHKLRNSQMPSGAWSWMPGGRWESEWVTCYILKTFGQMKDASGSEAYKDMHMLCKALGFVDNENYKFYLECLKHPLWTPANIDYLYMRSLYPNEKPSAQNQKAYDFFYNNAKKNYQSYSGLYTQAELALIFQRHGDTKEARDLVRRMRESSLTNDEMGMYWRDNANGYLWNEHPIETQSLLIKAFEEVTPEDKTAPALMRQWLLKQKQTTSWNSDVASVNAIQALLGGMDTRMAKEGDLTILVGGKALETSPQGATGYQRQQWQGDSIGQRQANVTIRKNTDGIAWGAMFWQYFEDLDKVPYSETGIKMQKTLYRLNATGDMTAINDKSPLKVGDKIRVRILIDCDRNLEYLELKDPRTSAFEPVNTESGWRWNDGLGYYVAVYNASTSFFIDRLDKGKYVLEYDLYVGGSGEKLSLGAATIQCMYAPEFRCNTKGVSLKVER